MGLDMYIYKHEKGRAQIELDREKVIEESNNYVNSLYKTENIKYIVNDFIEKHKEHFISLSEKTFKSTEYKAKSILYGNTDFKMVQWNLFNNCSRFNYDVSEENKIEITKDFLQRLDKHTMSKEQSDRLELEKDLDKKLDDAQEEMAYWRKYHELNAFILDSFGGDNCEYTTLTIENIKEIKQFIRDDGWDTSQIDSILDSWDDTAVYSYYPWW